MGIYTFNLYFLKRIGLDYQPIINLCTSPPYLAAEMELRCVESEEHHLSSRYQRTLNRITRREDTSKFLAMIQS
jgi:hypothetical protein